MIWEFRSAFRKPRLEDTGDHYQLQASRDLGCSGELVALSNGELVVSMDDHSLVVFRWEEDGSLVEIRRMTGHTDAITSLVVTEKGELVSGSSDCTLRIWPPNAAGRATKAARA